MEKWSLEKANEWYESLPWIRGFNYVPSNRVNRIDYWQEYGWNETKECIEREFNLAQQWGFNAVRIISQLEVYIDQHDSFMQHLEEILQIAHKNNLYVMFCFGNDCVVQKENYSWPIYGPQSFDLGYHSGKAKSPHVTMPGPGYNLIDEPEYELKFYEMIKEIISKYKEDKRILIFDMYNEVGNSRRGMKSYPYLVNTFKIAREINPIQPLTACLWSNFQQKDPWKEVEVHALELSDVISYHCYENLENATELIHTLKEKYHRPLFNTEWLHRVWNNTVEEQFPLFYKEHVGCFNWGFVTGKSQTREPWEWLFDAYEKGKGKDWNLLVWQHDLVRANLKPYDYKEYEIIKKYTSLADEEYLSKHTKL